MEPGPAIKSVNVHGEELQVANATLRNGNELIRIALWRDQASLVNELVLHDIYMFSSFTKHTKHDVDGFELRAWGTSSITACPPSLRDEIDAATPDSSEGGRMWTTVPTARRDYAAEEADWPALQGDYEVLNTDGDVRMVESSDDDSASNRNLSDTAKVAEEFDFTWPPLQQPGTAQQGSILEEITTAAAHTANIAFQNSWHRNTAAARIAACLAMNAEHRRQRDIEDDTVHAAVKALSAVTSWESLKDPSGPLARLYEHASRDELQPGDGKKLIHAIIDEEETQEILIRNQERGIGGLITPRGHEPST